jgi:dCTP deaminase
MILSGEAIMDGVNKGRIFISDFSADRVNPNSYDLRLGRTLLVYQDEILDARKANKTTTIDIPDGGMLLEARKFYLGHSVEVVGSDNYVPIIHCKSGIARLGLFVHVTADLIDIGSKGNITFQLHPTVGVKVYPGMRIAQVTFWKVQGQIKLYSGKYQGSSGPVASLSFADFARDE